VSDPDLAENVTRGGAPADTEATRRASHEHIGVGSVGEQGAGCSTSRQPLAYSIRNDVGTRPPEKRRDAHRAVPCRNALADARTRERRSVYHHARDTLPLRSNHTET
jgi:hypothetical protein